MIDQLFKSDELENNVKQSNLLLKLLVFQVGKLTLALPVEQVKKVTKYTELYGSGLSYVNLTHIGKQEVTIVDLHQKLFKQSQDELFQEPGYFVISRNTIGDSLGIRVAKTPSLLDVPVSQIRLLPNSYRQADTLAIASHVAVIMQENEISQTIFILDLNRLI